MDSLWQQPGQDWVNNYKEEVGEAFLQVTWSVSGRGGGEGGGWVVRDESGRSREHVAVETESSDGWV